MKNSQYRKKGEPASSSTSKGGERVDREKVKLNPFQSTDPGVPEGDEGSNAEKN